MAEHKYVVFSLNEEEFGLDINTVHEIVQPRKIVKLPESSELIEGIINLRGAIIPVVDLKKRFYGIPTEILETTRIIIVEVGRWEVGIIVEVVSEVKNFSEKQISVLPPFIQHVSAGSGIKGVGKSNDRLVILLDLALVFSGEEINKIEEAIS
ncbi:MAG: purine-binding chemotaxis protein CheW [Clostridia bacterium]|mgnify:CR=1 FL=1|jgi:purine-binding chemotaxis protein CheW|nr:purine-binding chemotaxis protein CheW [Clostridia bacterium]